MGPFTTPCICTPQASCLLLVKLRSVFFFFSPTVQVSHVCWEKKSESYTDEQREEIVFFLPPEENHCNPMVCVLTDMCVNICLCCASQEERGKDGEQIDFSPKKKKKKQRKENLLMLFLAALGLCCCEKPFSGCGELWLFSSCSVRASHCNFSSCGAQALVAASHVRSSWTRD